MKGRAKAMANERIPGLGFHHIGLKTADFEKSKAFYTALGMREIAAWGEGKQRIAMLDIGNGDIIELFASGGDEYSANGKWIHFAMTVEDVDAAYAHALSIGALSHIAPKIVPLDSKPEKITIIGADEGTTYILYDCEVFDSLEIELGEGVTVEKRYS
jgi:catechol 2,3-dioxygenase-like lactoylglutathione lyase family enzyme